MFTDLRDNRAAWAEDLGTEAAILALGVTRPLVRRPGRRSAA